MIRFFKTLNRQTGIMGAIAEFIFGFSFLLIVVIGLIVMLQTRGS